MSTAMDNNGHDCDVVTSAESLYMAKQRVIDQYGTLRYTIAIGCSGGSLTQQWVANAYPGIYQGLLPTCSFPDTWTSSNQVVDYHLLDSYFADKENWGAGIAWSTAQEAAVDGDPSTTNALLSDAGFFGAANPVPGVPRHDGGKPLQPDDEHRRDTVQHGRLLDQRVRAAAGIGMGPGGERTRSRLRQSGLQQRRSALRALGAA